MQSVLITGGTGLVGKKLTKHLVEKGYHVIILTRSLKGKNNSDKINTFEAVRMKHMMEMPIKFRLSPSLPVLILPMTPPEPDEIMRTILHFSISLFFSHESSARV